nr:hypothetical protein [Stenotrophomonas geniculata]
MRLIDRSFRLGWQAYSWRLWSKIEEEWALAFPSVKMPGVRVFNQKERWHLRAMHSKRRVNYFAAWLLTHLKASDGTRISVSSTWVDQYPKAHDPSLKGSTSVELADLLLITHSCHKGQPAISHAVLLQAKCSDDPVELDGGSAGASSNAERDLLEETTGKIVVKTSKSGNLINPKFKSYQLPVGPGRKGLMKVARYLIIPKAPAADQPYNLLWPRSRKDKGGRIDHLSQAVLGMIQQKSTIGRRCYPPNPATPGVCPDDWSQLVHDLVNHYDSAPPLARFPSALPVVSRVVRSETYGYRRLGWLNRFLDVCAGIFVPAPSYIVPPGQRESNDRPEGEPIGGFTIIQVWTDFDEVSG